MLNHSNQLSFLIIRLWIEVVFKLNCSFSIKSLVYLYTRPLEYKTAHVTYAAQLKFIIGKYSNPLEKHRYCRHDRKI